MKPMAQTPVISPLRGDRKRGHLCVTHTLNCWSKLTEDLKVDILSRLPELDLITSKFVCKDWNFLISFLCIPSLSPPNLAAPFYGFLSFEVPDPGYKYLRLEFLPSQYYSRLFMSQFLTSKPSMQDCIMSLLPSANHDPSDIIDCCNGFVLLAADSQCYFVGNPETRQRIAVPAPLCNQHFHSSLVFDPSVSLSFKIFRYTRPAVDATPSNPLALEIFSSDSGSWSTHVLPLAPQNLYGFEWNRRSVYFKGALYYMSKAMYLVCIENVFLRPGMDLNVWAVELPDRDEALDGCIGYSSGCFYYSKRVTKDKNVLIWMLVGKGKNSTWVLKHSISVDRDIVSDRYMIVDCFKLLDSFRPRAFHPTDDMIVMACPSFLAFYHLETKCVVPVGYGPWRHRRKALLDHNWIFPYARSLLSLNDIASAAE